MSESKKELSKLQDFTASECTMEEIITETNRLVDYITKLVGIDIKVMIVDYKLNPKNVVHLIGICGSIISDIVMRDYAKLNNELVELRGPAPLPPIEEIKEE